jgi:3-oxoadipate enol-lactonase/4-carboxymuconolactone decarboxylase
MRIADDLAAAGHDVWIDEQHNKTGQDWRRSILDGLSDAHWVLGFLSKHSIRDPGACLDELAIALHVKGGAIATVLVESETEVQAPVSVTHIQWLDMHDWTAREAQGGPAWEVWYKAKFDEISAILTSPANQCFAGEVRELEGLLKPVSQEADIGRLAAEAEKLPAWIAIIVTSRPEEPILQQFGKFKPMRLEAASPESLADLRDYVRAWLEDAVVPAGDVDGLVERIVDASAGNFLYVRMLREAVAEGTLGLDQPEALPQGLAGLYQRWFWHRFPSAEDYGRYVPLLSVLVAAAHPVPEAVLAEMFGWSKRERANMLEGLGSLFERRPEGMAPFHKSLRDWLTDADAAGAAFVVDEEAGAKHLFDYLWSAFEKWAREPDGPLDAFCLAELPVQTARRTAAEIGKRIPIELFRIIKPALIRVAEMRSVAYAWQSALAWWGTTVLLATAVGVEADGTQAYAYTGIGDVHLTLGQTADALKSYQGGLAIRDRLTKAGPGNSEWQDGLSVSYDRVGGVLVAQGNLPEALNSFRKGLAIRLAKDEPMQCQSNGVSLFYDLVGPVDGPVVIFSNSLGTTIEMWDDVVPALAGRYRCLRYDTRGHGRSEVADSPITIEDLADDLAGLLDGLGIGQAHVVGLSIGGMTAQAFALRYPQKLKSLSLMATTAHMPPPELWAERAALVRAQGMKAIAEATMARWFAPGFRQRAPEKLAAVQARFVATAPAGYAVCCGAIAGMDLRAQIKAITAPTLIISGAMDPATPPAAGEYLRSCIANSEFIVLSQAAHLLAVEQAEVVAAHLGAFLDIQEKMGPQAKPADAFAVGLANRKAVLGVEHVERSLQNAGDFAAPWQDFITRVAWGEIWQDKTLPWKTRSMLTLVMMAALHREDEFKLHLRPALRNGVSVAELRALLLQASVYAGVPAANAAFRWAREALGDVLG